ncbi:hypothetical protein [Pedobacter deserti]|uniref:hypothetical protein n=1 Tax=Pedobacter deserti TaxID=2817382 RepID=UPI002108C4D0|nr:hypothetical protein [Pedobacter sp. SYSU D00382]
MKPSKRLNLISPFIFYLLIAAALTSCKKDNPANADTRLKSIATVEGQISRKIVFLYDRSGLLMQTKHYQNSQINAYTDYQYASGKIAAAQTYEQFSGKAARLILETSFVHAGDRLVRVEMVEATQAARKFVYEFDYSSGEIPKVTTVLPKGAYLEDGTGMPPVSTTDMMQDVELDDKRNPLRGLPYVSLIHFEYEQMKGYAFSFNAVGYFLPNNVTRQGAGYMDMLTTNQYTYNKAGFPVRCLSMLTPGGVKSEHIYEY